MSDFEDIFARAVTGISDSSTPVTDYYNSDGGNGAGTWDGGGSSSEPTYGVTPDERNTFIIVVLSILVIMGVFFIIGGLFVKAEAHAKSTTRGGQHGDPIGENDMEHEGLFNIDLDVWEHPV